MFGPASLGDQCRDGFKHTLRYRNCNLKCDYDIRDIGGGNEQNNNDEIEVWVSVRWEYEDLLMVSM